MALVGYVLEDLDPNNVEGHCPAFYRRVKSRMIAKQIIRHLKTVDYEILKNQSEQYTWGNDEKEEMNRPTMLWLLLQACCLSTCVGVLKLKTYIDDANLS